jgi:DNA-binding transcriptional MerR regulator
MGASMTLAELAEATGLPPRTIRFYIARGLLKGPSTAGRAATYSPDHLARLERIKELQAQGRVLSEIVGLLDGGETAPAAVQPTAWWRHDVAEDVIVWTRADASPWRTRHIRAAIDEFARRLQHLDNEKE